MPPMVEDEPVRADRVHRAVEEALERRADREAQKIRVVVNEGKVTLSGYVHSWFERRAVLGVVCHLPGVHEVEDLLKVETYI